ncbi:MAG: hypothetical protein JRF62_01430 [Deltaproteobacteria bacterium]|nr:hypothetical protein [Deltaproteobacteria bacterium]MBW2598392.1 hypothetical protein [Deltaproteobacteria bacterium]MBW2639718.1 hypothetical protein [Deltaproteobacteria bacterium]
MKQKYLLLKNDEKTKLIIREFAELDKNMFTFLCEETFDDESVKSAIAIGEDALIATLRTKNLFPIGIYAKELAAAVTKMYESGNDQSVELIFDDHDIMKKEQEEPLVDDDIEDEGVEIDDLLDEDPPLSNYDDKNEIENITYSPKIDNDSTNGEDDD